MILTLMSTAPAEARSICPVTSSRYSAVNCCHWQAVAVL